VAAANNPAVLALFCARQTANGQLLCSNGYPQPENCNKTIYFQ
jgi:hypothetical protein